jgi:hypothetical protein
LLQNTAEDLAGISTPMHIASVVDQSFKFRVSIQPRTRPIGTYTYVITRKDDPDWGETSAEYFFTREEASAAGRAALDRLLKRRTS